MSDFKGRPVPEMIEVISHLHDRHAFDWTELRGRTDFEVLTMHDAQHDAPRSLNHHADDYSLGPLEA
jgi:hypothetical protein